jgi:hypothetical protein
MPTIVPCHNTNNTKLGHEDQLNTELRCLRQFWSRLVPVWVSQFFFIHLYYSLLPFFSFLPRLHSIRNHMSAPPSPHASYANAHHRKKDRPPTLDISDAHISSDSEIHYQHASLGNYHQVQAFLVVVYPQG